MGGVEYGHELDFALGWFFIYPKGYKGLSDYTIDFHSDCPEEIKQKVLELWPTVKKETERRHERLIYTSRDYFY